MANSLIIFADHQSDDPRSISFAIVSEKNGRKRASYVHMTDDSALKVAHRIMALASSGDSRHETFEGE